MRAVLERDYLAEARRPRAFLARTVIGGVAAAVLLFQSTAGWEVLRDSPDRIGSAVFGLLGRATFAFLAVLTPTLVVGTILAERRQNTLPLLLASPVTGTGLALGKFLSRTGTVLAWASAALPPLVLTLLFGGVSGRQAANLALALLGTAVELAAWGLLVSCLVRRLATAAVFVYLLPVLRWAAVGALPFTLPAAVVPVDAWVAGEATTPLPAVLGLAAWDERAAVSGFSGPLPLLVEHPGLGCLAFSLLLAGASVLLSGRLLDREEERLGRFRPRRASPRWERRFRRRLTGGNPVAWKESLLLNAAGSRSLYYAVGAALLAGEIVFLVLHGLGQWTPEMDFHLLWVAATALATLAAITGAASVAQEKSQGSLELLRISLLSPAEIAHGKVRGVAVGLGWLFLLPLGHLAVATLAGLAHPAAALLAAAAAALFVACYLVVGVHWGIVAGAAWAALAGSVALPVLGMVGCSLCCVLPLLLVVVNMARGGTRVFLESLVLPGILAGPAFLTVGALPSALHQVLGGRDSFELQGSGLPIVGGIFLLLQVAILANRWKALPPALRREMARHSEGEDAAEGGLAPYRVSRRAPLRWPPPAAEDGEGAP